MGLKRLAYEQTRFENLSRGGNGFVGGVKYWTFLDIAGHVCETEFWSNNEYDWLEMDYAHAMASMNNPTYIDGDIEFAEVLARHVYTSGVMIARYYFRVEGNKSASVYWLRWAKSQMDKALNLGHN